MASCSGQQSSPSAQLCLEFSNMLRLTLSNYLSLPRMFLYINPQNWLIDIESTNASAHSFVSLKH